MSSGRQGALHFGTAVRGEGRTGTVPGASATPLFVAWPHDTQSLGAGAAAGAAAAHLAMQAQHQRHQQQQPRRARRGCASRSRAAERARACSIRGVGVCAGRRARGHARRRARSCGSCGRRRRRAARCAGGRGLELRLNPACACALRRGAPVNEPGAGWNPQWQSFDVRSPAGTGLETAVPDWVSQHASGVPHGVPQDARAEQLRGPARASSAAEWRGRRIDPRGSAKASAGRARDARPCRACRRGRWGRTRRWRARARRRRRWPPRARAGRPGAAAGTAPPACGTAWTGPASAPGPPCARAAGHVRQAFCFAHRGSPEFAARSRTGGLSAAGGMRQPCTPPSL